MATVLAVASRALLEGCARLGIPTDEVLAQAGISQAAINDPDARIDAAKSDALWRIAWERSGDPNLALHAAEGLSFGAYRVIDYLVANSATVGEGVERIVRYFPIIDPRGQLELRTGDPRALVMNARGRELPSQAQEYTFAVIVTRIRSIVGAAWRLSAVDFTFPEPADAGEHRRVFQAPVRFGCAEARLLIPADAWAGRIHGAQSELLQVLEDYARRRLSETPPTSELTERARRAIAESLRGGHPELRAVARALAVSERSLQRHLRSEATSFAAVSDEVRYSLARGYLSDPRIALAEIAFLLGFADQAAFTRAFRRWTGTTPKAWRTENAGSAR